MIKATIVGDSLSPQGNRLTSVLCTFPRIILAEVNTHRMLSKNTSSSRAIPFNKMVEVVQNNPFIPIAWQKEHKGMQGTEYFTDAEISKQGLIDKWLQARNYALQAAIILSGKDMVTKQLCNRLLEPFMWTTMLITGSKEGWDNFFELRCPQYALDVRDKGRQYFKSKKDFANYVGKESDLIKHGCTEEKAKELFFKHSLKTDLDWLKCNKGQAEIHMTALAECIYDAVNESTPKQLSPNEWHIPFEDKIDMYELNEYLDEYDIDKSWLEPYAVKISTAMAARTSYTVVGDEKEIDYEKMIELHDRLISQNPPHSSPMEHCARAMSDTEYNQYTKTYPPTNLTDDVYNFNTDNKVNVVFDKGWCKNFKGFIQYRYLIETRQ